MHKRAELNSSACASRADVLDADDELAGFRSRFSLPARVYLCGHSLGAQPWCAREAVNYHLDKWATQGVEGHFTDDGSGWATLEDSAADAGCEIVGARAGESVYMNSLTVNLHLLLTAFYQPDLQSGRVEVLIEDHAFPSDDYAIQSHLRARGVDADSAIIRLAPRADEELLLDEDVMREIRDRSERGTLALVLLPGVQYFTGQVLDMQSISSLCNERSVPVGFDLAHAVGNIPLQLHDWGVDFAVWCSYKYLNSGPGSLGGAFVHSRHGDCSEMNRLGGWWGHERKSRFAMGSNFLPQVGVYGFQLSNPSVLGLAPVTASLKLFSEAGGMKKLRRKSVELTGFLEAALLDCLPDDIEIISPTNPARRGCQLSIRLRRVQSTVRVVQDCLKQRGIVCDVREPSILRVAPTPLYNSFADVEIFVSALETILAELRDGKANEICYAPQASATVMNSQMNA